MPVMRGVVGAVSFRTFQCPIQPDAAFRKKTGARSYYLGFGEPVNLKPYFDEIQMHLNNHVSVGAGPWSVA